MRLYRFRPGVEVLALSALLASLTGACGPAEKGTVTIAQSEDFFLNAPLYVAVDAGLFKQQQLDVAIVSAGDDEKAWAAVLSGSASFGVVDPTVVALSGHRGQPGRVIASIVNRAPFWGVTFRTDVPEIKNLEHLRGYTVATFPEPSAAFLLQRRMFADGGLTPAIRQGGPGTLVAMLDAKQADLALEREPDVTRAVKRGGRVVYTMPKLYGDFASTGLTATPSLISSDPSLVRRTLCGLQLALDYIHNRHGDTLTILLKRFPSLDFATAEDALKHVIDESVVPSDLSISQEAWAKAVDLRAKASQIDLSAANYLDMTVAGDVKAAAECRLQK